MEAAIRHLVIHGSRIELVSQQFGLTRTAVSRAWHSEAGRELRAEMQAKLLDAHVKLLHAQALTATKPPASKAKRKAKP